MAKLVKGYFTFYLSFIIESKIKSLVSHVAVQKHANKA